MESSTQIQTIEDIKKELLQLCTDIGDWVEALKLDPFNAKKDEKWSIAEEFLHMLKSTRPVAKALKLPKLTFRAFGTPNRDSRDYAGLVKRYHERIAEAQPVGGAGYGPKEGETINQEVIVAKWRDTTKKVVANLPKWDDSQLDAFLMPHPLLGKLTVREMLFFTHFHLSHHYESLKGKHS